MKPTLYQIGSLMMITFLLIIAYTQVKVDKKWSPGKDAIMYDSSNYQLKVK